MYKHPSLFFHFKCCLLLIAAVFTFLTVTGQSSTKDWFTIKAFLPAWNGAYLELSINDRLVARDTIKEDMFSFTGSTNRTQEGSLRIVKDMQTVFIPLFVEQGVIKLRDQGNQLVVYNTETNDTYFTLQTQWDSLVRGMQSGSFETAAARKRSLAIDYIRHHPASAISLRLLYEHFYKRSSIDEALYHELFQMLDAEIKNSTLGRKIGAEAKERFATAVGNEAPLLMLPDRSKQLKPVYEKGKVTLISFWASWCAPCLREIPAIQSLNDRFSANGLVITSISMDTNRASWMNAIERNKLGWTQLSDLKGWYSPVVNSFGLKLIPHNILIGADGRVLGKNLHIEEVESMLQVLFAKSF
jgi:thiol-disulfide isomerase/thioredoxin